MRKIYLIKVAGGKEIAKVYLRDNLIKTFKVGPGFEEYLYLAIDPFKADNVRIDIETVELDQNGKSEYEILCEWEVMDPGNVDFDEINL